MKLHVAGSAFRDLRHAFEQTDYREVLATGESAIAALDGDPNQQDFVPGAMVLVGGALLSIEHYHEGLAWLERGLAQIRGTASEHELRGADWFHRALADTYLLVGHWQRAEVYLDWLALPEQPLESRLAATRGRSFLAATRGRFDDADLLLNASADLARRSRSEVAEAMVEADRALALGGRGRLHEAVATADGVMMRLAAPGTDDRQQWANQHATAALTSLARMLAEAGDLMTAERYLLEASVPAGQSRRTYVSAQYGLACSVVWRQAGDLERAEEPLLAAIEQFSVLDTLPALALARLAEAKLADARAHTLAARALYRRAGDELAALGMPREQDEAARRARALG